MVKRKKVKILNKDNSYNINYISNKNHNMIKVVNEKQNILIFDAWSIYM